MKLQASCRGMAFPLPLLGECAAMRKASLQRAGERITFGPLP